MLMAIRESGNWFFRYSCRWINLKFSLVSLVVYIPNVLSKFKSYENNQPALLSQ